MGSTDARKTMFAFRTTFRRGLAVVMLLLTKTKTQDAATKQTLHVEAKPQPQHVGVGRRTQRAATCEKVSTSTVRRPAGNFTQPMKLSSGFLAVIAETLTRVPENKNESLTFCCVRGCRYMFLS